MSDTNKGNSLKTLDRIADSLNSISYWVAILTFTSIVHTCTAKADNLTPKYKIAILDTGYDSDIVLGTKLKLCKTGHYDFKTDTPVLAYTTSHGTAVAAIIANRLRNIDYCAVIYQYQDAYGNYTIRNMIRALKMIRTENIDALNLSMTGPTHSIAERDALKSLTSIGTNIFVAAGNEGFDLDLECLAFPVCYDIPNLYPVGGINPASGERLKHSNYGEKVKLWFSGDRYIYSRWSPSTSFAVPRALSEFISRLDNK